MPTAIIRNYTGDAFIVAADGMAQGTSPTLSRRKIFQFGGNKWLAYAFAGRVAIGPREGPEIWFDFRERIEKAVQSLSLDHYATLSEYATALRDHAHRALIKTCTSDQIAFDNATELGAPFAHVFISGYFKQVASSVIIEFYRENRQFAKPNVSPDELIIGEPRRHGSYIIDAYLSQNHPPFFNDWYRRALEVPLPHFSEAMKGAVLRSRQYIEVCSSPEARALDDFCKEIGGDIHMASITPKDGIRWVPGFEHEENL
jgi:hypothetical protein